LPQQIAKLPIDDLLPAIRESLGRSSNLVIEAPPGAGKTTRVPPALLDVVRGQVLVLEPRRLAARLAARRVARELGERLGETIGYQVRFEEVAGAQTRLRFLTEGILTRRLLSDRTLAGVDAVILDEFHERHLETDLALALLRRLQLAQRPDLLLIVMSATLDATPVATYLGSRPGGCPVLRSEGRLFDLSVTHLPYSALPIEKQVAAALETLIAQAQSGDVLVFLPGAAEIRRAERECRPLAAKHDLLVLPLYGDLSPAEQDAAVSPAPRRKVILSTNVAESSITVEGVTAVIDSGLARVASDSPWTGLPTLDVARISKASATQRAGRAARTAPGRVIRLYTVEDFHRRRDQDPPEILRRELSELCLALRAMGIANPLDLEWLDAPPEPAVARAEDLLERLGATGERARRMARYPLHPRLARLVLEAVERGAGEEGCRAAALLSSGARSPSCDLLNLIDSHFDPVTQRHFEQIRRIVRPSKPRAHDPHALALSILTAFPDRVARRRKDDQLLLASGGSAALACDARVDFLVAVDIEDRSEHALPLVRLYCPIEAAWLLDLFPDRVTERTGVEWNRSAERVEAVSALLYENLVIEETRSGAPDPEQAAALLAERALEAGIERFVDREELEQFLARVAFAAEHASMPKLNLPGAFRELCRGLKSFTELKSAGASLIPSLEQRAGAKFLSEVAPSHIRLPGGRQTKVNYETGKPPWIASRLQDFFGMRETPRVANGKVALVVHLLAPNRRPMQMTTDLEGFWQRLYPQLRRELGRRYPKHAWPEDPYSARD
jgi:ATP-dependent RNA helicase HrpB